MSTTTTKIKPTQKSSVSFRPNGSTILIKHIDVEEVSQEGTILIPNPNFAAHQTVRAEVVAIGKESKGFTVGDIVMVHQKVGNAILLDGVGYVVARGEDIVGFYE